jgi:AcrR family transcriptional regulator
MPKSKPPQRRARPAPAKAAASPAEKRLRLPPAEREEMLIKTALDFIAEKGFHADTAELARRAGVSHGLVFRYFGTKEKLIERVYERNFVARWLEEWEAQLADRAIPLRERLTRFYRSYFRAIDEYSWVRISLFSGLNGHDLTRRYIETFVDRVLSVIAREIRWEGGRDDDAPLSDDDMEIAWHLHSTFIYLLIRRYIYETRTLDDTDRHVDLIVDRFLDGAVPPKARSRGRPSQAKAALDTGLPAKPRARQRL